MFSKVISFIYIYVCMYVVRIYVFSECTIWKLGLGVCTQLVRIQNLQKLTHWYIHNISEIEILFIISSSYVNINTDRCLWLMFLSYTFFQKLWKSECPESVVYKGDLHLKLGWFIDPPSGAVHVYKGWYFYCAIVLITIYQFWDFNVSTTRRRSAYKTRTA